MHVWEGRDASLISCIFLLCFQIRNFDSRDGQLVILTFCSLDKWMCYGHIVCLLVTFFLECSIESCIVGSPLETPFGEVEHPLVVNTCHMA